MSLPPGERLQACHTILQNEEDESLRGEAVWVIGNLADEIEDEKRFGEIAELLEWVLKNDKNDVVKHEACFQLGEKKMKNKTHVLMDVAINDPSELVRHEAIEALGLMKAFECRQMLQKSLQDKNDGVKQTAVFVLKQLDRLERAMNTKCKLSTS